MLNYIIYAYFILGFLLIIAAPLWKLFKKAGKSGWALLVPVYNIFEFGRTNNIASYLLAVPIAAIVFTLSIPFLIGIVQIENSFLFFLQLLLLLIFCFCVLTVFFFYPFLSICMCALLIFLTQYITAELAILKIVFLLLILLELAVEIIYWLAILKKIKQPLWQLIFPLLPLLPLIVIFLTSELKISLQAAGSIMVNTLLFLSLLSGLIYLYYLGFSMKVKY
jgi:hypothetical protein